MRLPAPSVAKGGERGRLSFSFSKEMLAHAAANATQNMVVPPLHRLSIRPSPTAAATAPNAQFRLAIKVLNHAALSEEGLSALYGQINALGRDVADDSLLLLLEVTRAPTDTERVAYANAVSNYLLQRLQSLLRGNLAKGQVVDTSGVITLITPPGGPISKLDMCNPYTSSSTVVFLLKNKDKEGKKMLGKLGIKKGGPHPSRQASAAQTLGSKVFGSTPGDNVPPPAQAQSVERENLFERVVGEDYVQEVWTRIAFRNDSTGDISYDFTWDRDVEGADNDGGARNKRQRREEPGAAGGSRDPL